jgi:PIN domain nuclease of toxin-antitoxin system
MIVYVLDSSALIRYVDNEAGADRVEEILGFCAGWQASLRISAVQWGEVAGNLRHRFGATQEERILSGVIPSEAEIVPATSDRAKRAGEIRVDHGISYADSFAVELTLDSSEYVLVTADYGFKPVADLIKIEFLPSK